LLFFFFFFFFINFHLFIFRFNIAKADDDEIVRTLFEECLFTFDVEKISGSAVSFRQDDLDRMKSGCWLNDTCINFYILFAKSVLLPTVNDLLSKDGIQFSGPAASCLQTQFYQLLEKEGRNRKNSPHFEGKNFLAVPINYSGYHWLLAIISFEERKIYILDSLGKQYVDTIEKNLLNYLQKNGKDGFQVVYVNVPQQSNGCDCGVFLLHNLERFLFSNFLRDGNSNCSNLFKEEEISEKRNEILSILMYMKENPKCNDLKNCEATKAISKRLFKISREAAAKMMDKGLDENKEQNDNDHNDGDNDEDEKRRNEGTKREREEGEEGKEEKDSLKDETIKKKEKTDSRPGADLDAILEKLKQQSELSRSRFILCYFFFLLINILHILAAAAAALMRQV